MATITVSPEIALALGRCWPWPVAKHEPDQHDVDVAQAVADELGLRYPDLLADGQRAELGVFVAARLRRDARASI